MEQKNSQHMCPLGSESARDLGRRQAHATSFASEKAIIADSTFAVEFPRALPALQTLRMVPPPARTKHCLLLRRPDGTTGADQEPAQTCWRARSARKRDGSTKVLVGDEEGMLYFGGMVFGLGSSRVEREVGSVEGESGAAAAGRTGLGDNVGRAHCGGVQVQQISPKTHRRKPPTC